MYEIKAIYMKLFPALVATAMFSVAASAQQTTATAVRSADGLIQVHEHSNEGSGVSANSGVGITVRPKAGITVMPNNIGGRHEAILNPDGTREIRFVDAGGTMHIIHATENENLEKKYWAYLREHNLPCGCSAELQNTTAGTPTESTVTETHNATIIRDGRSATAYKK